MTEMTLLFHDNGWDSNCTITLKVPYALVHLPMPKLKKLIRIVGAWCGWGEDDNREALRKLFDAVPIVRDDLKDQWDQGSLRFQREYRDPKFDSNGHMREKMDREKVRYANKRLLEAVKQAKKDYESFLKKMAALEELKALYMAEKEAE